MPQRIFRSVFLTGMLVLAAGPAHAQTITLTPVPAANAKQVGVAVPNFLSVELTEVVRAEGSMRLENGTADFLFYGYNGDGPFVPLPGDVQAPGHNVEATKTEPDKNTYLVLPDQRGADPDYDYGTHFLFQGHESGVGTPKKGYITRINLDADVAHRVTLLAITDILGNPLPVFDGSTWYPFSQHLLFTAELGADGGVWQATADVPSTVIDISGALGRGGYEGIQADSAGNLWIVEDVGGPFGGVNVNARQPNSFIYRFVPSNTADLTAGGKLQVLAVQALANGDTILFHAGQADADILSQDIKDLHTYGNVFKTTWVTIHDTAVDGNAPFSANALAKAVGTPFKRPENGMFRPGSLFREFFFTETGDTDLRTQAGSQFGGFGALFKLTQQRPSDDTGALTLFFLGDPDHTGFDNLAFLTDTQLVAVEDRGDTLHTQHNALDSAFVFDVTLDYSQSLNQPLRMLAQGRDVAATIDSVLGSITGSGFQNDGDNEITGFHVSNGDPTVDGLLGKRIPHPFRQNNEWRVFYTHQHGDNVTYEILRTEHVPKAQ